MKKIVVILLSCLVLLTSIRDITTFAYFYLNQDYIVNNLCVNRDNPERLCSGKCYLAASLENNTSTQQLSLFPPQQELCWWQPLKLCIIRSEELPTVSFHERVTIHYYSPFYMQSFGTDIFHPPALRA